jgi:hypothetical protein
MVVVVAAQIVSTGKKASSIKKKEKGKKKTYQGEMWRLEPLMLLLPLCHRTVVVVVWTPLTQQGGG